PPVEQHCARAADALSAALLDVEDAERVAQHLEQRLARPDVHIPRSPVDHQPFPPRALKRPRFERRLCRRPPGGSSRKGGGPPRPRPPPPRRSHPPGARTPPPPTPFPASRAPRSP